MTWLNTPPYGLHPLVLMAAICISAFSLPGIYADAGNGIDSGIAVARALMMDTHTGFIPHYSHSSVANGGNSRITGSGATASA